MSEENTTPEENKSADLNINAKLDFSINKEDVVNIMVVEREKELVAILDEKKVEQKELFAKMHKQGEKIITTLESVLKLPKTDKLSIERSSDEVYKGLLNITSTSRYSDSRHDNEDKNVKTFAYEYTDVRRLKDMNNPKREIEDNKSLKTLRYPTLRQKIEVLRTYKQDGFEGTLVKKDKMPKDAKLTKVVTKYGEIYEAYYRSKEAVQKADLELLLLDTDKEIKSNMIKNIVSSSDFKQFLGMAPSEAVKQIGS